jgi:hypothetical protein
VKLFDFMVSPQCCGSEFTGPSWATWRILARLYDGDAELLTDDEYELAKAITGRECFPMATPPELYIGAGRRSGKTRFASLLAVYAAAQDYSLSPGGHAVAAIVAPDRRQAQLAFSYARGLVMQSAILRDELVRETSDSLEFKHSTKLEVLTGNFRAVRGYSTCLAICDEAAFLMDSEGRNSDEELARALRPALATLNGSMVVISSPHRRRGILFDAYEKFFAHDTEPCLYVQASSTTLNPTLNQASIERAIANDPEGGKAEWLGLFRDDSSEYLPDELIDAAIVPDRMELPHQLGRNYAAFVDLAGGVERGCSAVLAVAHKEPGTRAEHLVLDQLHEAPAPHKPADVVKRFAATLQRLNISSVVGDRYAAAWPVNAFSDCGIGYQVSELNRSAIYGEVAPLFMDRRVELLDHKELIKQLRGLERNPKAGGRPDEIKRGPRRHEDLINAAAGALWLASMRPAASDEYGEGSITHAITSYDPLTRDSQPEVRRPRAVGSLANMRFEEEFDQADRNYDPLSRD